MSQFGTPAGKNPPWARQGTDFLAMSATSSIQASTLTQAQVNVATTLLPQPGVVAPNMYNIGAAPMPQSQALPSQFSTAQQLAAVTLQQAPQQQAAVAVAALQQAQGTVLPQPGIAIPTSLATTTQVATVSYPAPRATHPMPPKQRVFTGAITKLHDNFGFVDDDVFFQTSCVKGNMAKAGDRVLVEASYNPNMPFRWNATRIQVLPNQSNTVNAGTSGPGMMGVRPPVATFGGNPPSNLGLTVPPALSTLSPQPLMQQSTQPMDSLRSGRREGRFDRDRDRKRDDRVHRDKSDRGDRFPVNRKRSRSPPKKSPARHSRSPVRRRARIVPRYVVQIPKISLDMKEANVVLLKNRYANMYIPSDFFHSSFSWMDCFPVSRPFQMGHHCTFHVLHKNIEPIGNNDAVLDPPDVDHTYSAKVMLMSCPTLEDLYHKCCGLSEDPENVQENCVHPTRLIQFLVGVKGKNEPIAIGGPWSASLDGPNPQDDPRVLIKTAIRTTKALTGVDLSACTQWYQFAEVRYLRPEETHKGKQLPSRVERCVIFLPDVWSCQVPRTEWASLQSIYKKQLQKKLHQISNDGREESQEEEEGAEDEVKNEPTHFSELDPRTMKILDLRSELESRNLSSKGLKSQLIARLTKSLKSEQEKEAEEENMEAEEAVAEKGSQEVEDVDVEKKREEEDKKKKIEKEKVTWKRRYTLPENPCILVHPNAQAKNGKFDCSVMSLSVLLDYRPEDNKEHSFEVSLFAELFNEMLTRDFAFHIYKSLCSAPEKPKEEVKKDKEKEKSKDREKEKDDELAKVSKREKEEDRESCAKKKKIDEKEKRDSEKKESSAKKKKIDEKEKRDSEKKEIKEKKKDGSREGSSKKDTDEEEEMDENNDDEDGKGSNSKGKRKEKKKYVTKDPMLLLASTYFDQNHTGYLLDKDVEEIIHIIGLQLSRAQVRKLVQRVVVHDMLNYRKLTDKLVPSPGEEQPSEEKSEIELDITKVAAGNLELLQKSVFPAESSQSRKHVAVSENLKPEGGEQISPGLVDFRGALVDVGSVMQRLEKSEKSLAELEKQLQSLSEEKDSLKKSLSKKEEAYQKLTSDLKNARHQVSVQEKLTTNSELLNKKYLSALMESKSLLTTLVNTVSDALDEKQKEMKSELAHIKTEPTWNGDKS